MLALEGSRRYTLWLRTDQPDGGARVVVAHRVSWQLHNGPIPDGLCVLHKCDNPKCVRPDHLFLGTRADNARDRDEKGRTRPARGTRRASAKLSDTQVREIRLRSARGETQRALGTAYGVSHTVIGHVVRGTAWTHVV